MNENIFIINNKVYSNNNNLLLEIVKDLHQIMNYSKDNLIIKILGNVINKMNYIINENKKNIDLIRKDISSLLKKFDELKINNIINNQELQHENGKYIGPVINGLAEGRGIWYGTKEPFVGDRYEGEFRNNKKEGKGIYYYSNGDREMGDYFNDKSIGKQVMLTKNNEVKVINY